MNSGYRLLGEKKQSQKLLIVYIHLSTISKNVFEDEALVTGGLSWFHSLMV